MWGCPGHEPSPGALRPPEITGKTPRGASPDRNSITRDAETRDTVAFVLFARRGVIRVGRDGLGFSVSTVRKPARQYAIITNTRAIIIAISTNGFYVVVLFLFASEE